MRLLRPDFCVYLVKVSMRIVVAILCLFLLCACGATYTVDYQKEQDFSNYTTYQFWPDVDSGLGELDNKRIYAAIDSVLQSKGITQTDYNRFYVNFYASEIVDESRNTLGVGIGSGGGNVGVGVSGGIPIGGPVIRQQLTIDFIDESGSQDLVWQVIIDGDIKERATPKDWEAYYLKVITKALTKFPPKLNK